MILSSRKSRDNNIAVRHAVSEMAECTAEAEAFSGSTGNSRPCLQLTKVYAHLGNSLLL